VSTFLIMANDDNFYEKVKNSKNQSTINSDRDIKIQVSLAS